MIGEWILWLQVSVTPLRTGWRNGGYVFSEIAMTTGTNVRWSTCCSFDILGADKPNLFARAEARTQDW
jgi:hypothetical protein